MAAGQLSRPVSSAIKRPLRADGRTNSGQRTSAGLFVCLFFLCVHRYVVHCLRNVLYAV